MDKALVLKDFSMRCGEKHIFSDVNLEVNRGEIIAICGTAAGSMYALPSVLTRSFSCPAKLSGSVFVDNAEIDRLPDEDMRFVRMMNIGVLPRIYDVGTLSMSVQSYLTMPFRESVKKSKREIMLDAKRIMQLFDVSNPDRILKKRMSSLSKKVLRAVLFAAALSTDPAVAIAYDDMPDLTPEEKDALFTLLIKICKIKNIALLLFATDIRLARQFGERIFISKHDRIIPLEGASHPYVKFLERAEKAEPLPQDTISVVNILEARHVLPARGMERLDFILHKGEMISFACKNGPALFSGKRKPVRGAILADDTRITKQFKKSVMSVSAKMPLLPTNSVDNVVCAYAACSSLRQETAQFYSALSLPTDYGKTPVKTENLFEVLQLGLVCAAISEAKLILLSDIDKLCRADRYELLTLLSAVCSKTGAGAIVFSNEDDVHRAVSKAEEPVEMLT